MMLQPKDYIADWPDLTYHNFIEWLEGQTKKFAQNEAILYRPAKQKDFTVWTYSRFGDECRRIARGLLAAGLKKGDRVVLWAENCPEWMAAWMGTVVAGCVIVPVDFLITEDECANIIKMTGAKAIFYSGRKTAFSASLAGRGFSSILRICLSDVEVKTGIPFSQFGRDADGQDLPPASSIDGVKDAASIVFTSGTTGFAKGVVLSHNGIIQNVNGAILSVQPSPPTRFVSVLPLHHTYPTTCSFLAPLTLGIATIIVEKLVGKVVINDIRDGHGTLIIAVPLLYDKMMQAIDSELKKLPGLVRFVLNKWRAKSLREMNAGRPEWGQKRLQFLRNKTGLGSVDIMVAGGGALNPITADFFSGLGFNVLHGYGMSENGPLISVNTTRHKRNASVGLPVKNTQVRIDNGEIVVTSPSIMLGYYNNPEATQEIMTEDGWLRTGDLGYIDEQGFIYINGRAKNLIVGAGGKNVYPEEIESHFASSRAIEQILVLGRRRTDLKGRDQGEQVYAVVVPSTENIAADYPGKEIDKAFIHDLIKKEIEAVNRTLPSYKKISDFCLRQEAFEVNAQQKIRRFLYKDYAN
jgi:long-chain acyl-CoA synthetase